MVWGNANMLFKFLFYVSNIVITVEYAIIFVDAKVIFSVHFGNTTKVTIMLYKLKTINQTSRQIMIILSISKY